LVPVEPFVAVHDSSVRDNGLRGQILLLRVDG